MRSHLIYTFTYNLEILFLQDDTLCCKVEHNLTVLQSAVPSHASAAHKTEAPAHTNTGTTQHIYVNNGV